MAKAREWALVIQGPLHSPVPANSWLRDLLELRAAAGEARDEVVVADCSAAIEATVENARSRVSAVVLATWNDEANAAQAYALERRLGLDVVLLDDPGPSSWVPCGPPDNRVRQLLSSVRGLERVARRTGAEYVIRTRSDQVVDVAAAIAYVDTAPERELAYRAGQLDFVYVPAVFVASPYSIDDFYFAGTVPDLLRFFWAQWRLRNRYFGTSSIHVDLVLKHLYMNLRVPLGAGWVECYPHVTNPRDLDASVVLGTIGRRYVELWTRILRTAIRPLPCAVYDSIVFRGVPYSLRFPRLFAEDWEALGDGIASTWTSQAPRVYSNRAFGLLGLFLNYGPEAALAHRRGLIGEAARAVDRGRARLTTFRRKSAWEPTLTSVP